MQDINDNEIGEGTKSPCNIDAEKAILGSFLNNNENITRVGDFLKAEHFYVPLHEEIYKAILKLHDQKLIASPVTLKNYFVNNDALTELGVSSIEYLMKLSTNAASVINLLPYAQDVYQSAIRRNFITICEDSLVEAHKYDMNISALEVLEHAEQKLFALASEGVGHSGAKKIKDIVVSALADITAAKKRGGDVSGIRTGFTDLDKLLGGMQNSDLLILAARPSMGKTALAINIALNAAVGFYRATDEKDKLSVAVFSLEMSANQIMNRLFSIKTGIDSSKVRIGNLTKDEFNLLVRDSAELSGLPMTIDDTPALSISALRTRARRLTRQHKLGLIVIDYLQLLRGTSKAGEVNRVHEIGEISQGLKAIAKELNVPVLALSQLSRAVESRDDKHPQLSDLRESGNIEQDADVVMFIYREEYYLNRKTPQAHEVEKYTKWLSDMEKHKGVAEVLIAKQRNGPIGNVNIQYDTTTTGFTNIR